MPGGPDGRRAYLIRPAGAGRTLDPGDVTDPVRGEPRDGGYVLGLADRFGQGAGETKCGVIPASRTVAGRPAERAEVAHADDAGDRLAAVLPEQPRLWRRSPRVQARRRHWPAPRAFAEPPR